MISPIKATDALYLLLFVHKNKGLTVTKMKEEKTIKKQ